MITLLQPGKQEIATFAISTSYCSTRDCGEDGFRAYLAHVKWRGYGAIPVKCHTAPL